MRREGGGRLVRYLRWNNMGGGGGFVRIRGERGIY